MAFSAIGILRFKIYGFLLLINTVVLALSGHINHFQRFYYKADVLPFALSATTMFCILALLFLDFNSSNTFTSYPAFELAWLFLNGIIWLAFNAFSTSRWRYIDPSLCSTIPGDSTYAPYRTWCNEVQALRAFVWVEWVIFLLVFVYIIRWAIYQHIKGHTDVWTRSISRFTPNHSGTNEKGNINDGRLNSEFLQFDGWFPPTSLDPQEGQMEENAGRRADARAEPLFDFVSPVVPQQYLPRKAVEYAYSTEGPYSKSVPYSNNGAITPDPFASPLDYAQTHPNTPILAQSQLPSSSPSTNHFIFPTRSLSPIQPPSPSTSRAAFNVSPPSKAAFAPGVGAGIGAAVSVESLHDPYDAIHRVGSPSPTISTISMAPMKTKFAQAQAPGQSQFRYASSEKVV